MAHRAVFSSLFPSSSIPSFKALCLLIAGPTAGKFMLGFQSVKFCGLKVHFFFLFFSLNNLIELISIVCYDKTDCMLW